MNLVRRSLLLLGGALGLVRPSLAQAQAARAGTADFVAGTATLRGASLSQGTAVRQGDTVETGADGEVHITFEDGGYLAVRPSSAVRIDVYKATGAADDSAVLSLLRGALRSVTGWIGKFDNSRYKLTVGTATIGIRGTDHEVVFIMPGEARAGEEPGVHSRVNEGGTVLRNARGSLNVDAGTAGWSPAAGGAPRRHAAIPAFFEARRTRNEQRLQQHAARIREHMEQRLRQRGKLKPGETFEDLRARHQAQRQQPQNEHQRQQQERRRPHEQPRR